MNKVNQAAMQVHCQVKKDSNCKSREKIDPYSYNDDYTLKSQCSSRLRTANHRSNRLKYFVNKEEKEWMKTKLHQNLFVTKDINANKECSSNDIPIANVNSNTIGILNHKISDCDIQDKEFSRTQYNHYRTNDCSLPKENVKSVTCTKLHKIINKTSTKWMKAKANSAMPQSSQEFKEERCKSLSVQRERNNNTENCTQLNSSKISYRIPNDNINVNGFMQNKECIPNSYRINGDSSSVTKYYNTAPSLNFDNFAQRIANVKLEHAAIKNKLIMVKNTNTDPKLNFSQTKCTTDVKINSNDLQQEKIENYILLDLLGKGSYASVYLAKSIKHENKEVAIKIFEGGRKGKGIQDEIAILK